ncbi:MAG TPA: class F sortase [Candidatus Paceibacterota bacterium]|nr:class F sortase [Candidatus Paceibacterota bacterium]
MQRSSILQVVCFLVFFVVLVPVTHFVFVSRAHAASILSVVQQPSRLFIPSIGLNAPVLAVGVNAAGEMAVPSGKSNAVGWYAGGAVPGQTGSAVLDAHVFAAFSHLSKVAPGSNLYVTVGSRTLHFVVQKVKTYSLNELSPQMLFAQNDARRLNLITCAGSYVPALGTYDHRLVVYAVEVG